MAGHTHKQRVAAGHWPAGLRQSLHHRDKPRTPQLEMADAWTKASMGLPTHKPPWCAMWRLDSTSVAGGPYRQTVLCEGVVGGLAAALCDHGQEVTYRAVIFSLLPSCAAGWPVSQWHHVQVAPLCGQARDAASAPPSPPAARQPCRHCGSTVALP